MVRPITLGNALAATSGIFFTVCALFVALTPSAMHSVGEAWYGGMGMRSGGMMGGMTWGVFLYGLFWLLVGTWLFGALLGFLYNRFGGGRAGTVYRTPAPTTSRERTGVF